jgi:ketosteroid isomerase-like protein
MTGDNLEIARRSFQEMRTGSYEGGVWDPEVEVINAKGWALESSYHGHDGLRRWWDDLAEAFGEFDVKLEEVMAIDEERVLSTQRFVGQFRTTDIPFDGLWAAILWIRDGRVVRAQGFLSKRRAMRAAGMEVT